MDNTLLHKTRKKISSVVKFFDHTERYCVHAQNIVTNNYVNKYKEYLVNLKQYFKYN